MFVIGAGMLTSPSCAEVTIQREVTEEITSPEAEVWCSHENTEGKLENQRENQKTEPRKGKILRNVRSAA